MLNEVALALVGVVALAYSIDFAFGYFDDSREPRRVTPAIPIVGHLVGYMRHGFDYYNLIR
jgi:hypothetical protein